VTLELGAELSERVRELGGRHGATPFVTLLAGFRALLASALGERDVCIGTFMANRSGREAEALIGPLFNTVVLRNRVAEDATFARLLAEEREVLAGAHEHQAMPFEEVVEGGAPLCQILFASQHRSWDRMALAGLGTYDGRDYPGLYLDDPEQPGAFIDRRFLYVLRKPAVPSVIVETHHFLDLEEAARWAEPRTLEAFAAAVAGALVEALSKPPPATAAVRWTSPAQ
jgi:hypothetical protein